MALVQTGKVTPAKSMCRARDAHHEVNPHINVVIEFYEDAALVDPRTQAFLACHSFARSSEPAKPVVFKRKPTIL
ncbi:hypothetical protein [Mesorhizobium caraganae]|uniref:hypothetical protein n=1 Tax=Mesorhizobium caraganae TaxID=483206 RepID=UPI0017823574|nr:hypothetical protein [Mesorhizobium caraganae]